MSRLHRRRGQAIPLVMGFCFIAAIFVFAITSIRVEDKKQNLLTFQQLKAYYMAQGAIQHALLKVRILPNEAYDVGALSRGLCPLTAGQPDGDFSPKWPGGLDNFISDVNTTELPLEFAVAGQETESWGYEITSAAALTTFMKDTGAGIQRDKVNVLQFVAVGTIQDKLQSDAASTTGESKTRREQVTKIVEISRSTLN